MIDFELDVLQIDDLGEWMFAQDEEEGVSFYLCLDQDDTGEYSAVLVEQADDGSSAEISPHAYSHGWENILYKAKELIEESGVVEPADKEEYDYAKWTSMFIRAHEASGVCTVEEWDEFSDIYKDAYGSRPRPSMFAFDVVSE